MSPTTLGVIADTHVPDRAKVIPQKALDIFSDNQVTAILHAGDLSTRRVLDVLNEIAPVHAVLGNTDLFLLGQLPWVKGLEIESVTIGMVHGHGSWPRYVRDRASSIIRGPKKFSYYENLARAQLPDCQVVVCGHTHVPAVYWIEGQLVFNPGSVSQPNWTVPGLAPSIGLLHLDEGNVRGEIVFV